MTYSGDRILLGSQRESRISRFRPWVLFVVPLIAILFQVYIPLFFKFLAYLDLPLLVTVYFALMRRSPIAGTFIGAFIGLAQDSLSKYPLEPMESSRRWSATSPHQWDCGSTWTMRSSGCCWAFSFSSFTSSSPGSWPARCSASR